MTRLFDQPQRPDDADDPFRLGWRNVRVVRLDGTEDFDTVPLSEEDVLFPEEEDHVAQTPAHLNDFIYLWTSLRTLYRGRQDVVVLGDCRVDWSHETIRPLGPDVLVIFDVIHWRQKGTYRFAEEGGRPALVVEITSPSTWKGDIGPKVDFYYRLRIPLFVLLDRGPDGRKPLSMTVRQWTPDGWRELKPDAQGRVDLTPLPLFLAVEGNRPCLYESSLRALRDPVELAVMEQRCWQAEAQTRQEAAAREQAQTQAQEAKAEIPRERETVQQLEARVRALEELLRQRDNSP